MASDGVAVTPEGAKADADGRDSELSETASRRICVHMNDDHAVSVYAMLLRALRGSSYPPRPKQGKFSNVKLKSVSLKEYTIGYVTCDGDACTIESLTVPFDPPMVRSSQVKKRIVDAHHVAFAPNLLWLVTNPNMLVVVVFLGGLSGAVFGMGNDGLARAGVPFFEEGSSSTTFQVIQLVLYVSLCAHILEAAYVLYACKKVLKLKWYATLGWALMSALAGIAATELIMDFVAVDSNAASKKDEKKH